MTLPKHSSPQRALTAPYLLVVEDSDEDFEALERVLRKGCDTQIVLHRCCDGDEAMDFIQAQMNVKGEGPLPSLIMLDLNLPGTDGREVLSWIKRHSALCTLPVVVFTTSSNPKDIEACYQQGVNSYHIKPMNLEELKKTACLIVRYWFEIAVLPGQSPP